MTTPAPTFVFNGNRNDHEQVRPYFADYLALYNELIEAGRYPYDTCFENRIPGLQGDSERTGIYMLQCMRRRDIMHRNIEEFTARGAVDITTVDLTGPKPPRGTVAVYGYYVGNMGWQVYEDQRLALKNGRIVRIEPGRRNGEYLAGSALFLPNR